MKGTNKNNVLCLISSGINEHKRYSFLHTYVSSLAKYDFTELKCQSANLTFSKKKCVGIKISLCYLFNVCFASSLRKLCHREKNIFGILASEYSE